MSELERILSHPSLHRNTWAQEKFINADQAEAALCGDRPAFVSRNDIMRLIPKHIKKRILHSDALAQIRGFEDLFIFLNENRRTKSLRGLIETYFDNSPPLQGHLS
jgi:hypothetical protein